MNIHGGDIAYYISKYGYSKNDILDFSANINPLGPPLELKECVLSQIDEVIRYPDIEYTALRNSMAQYIDSFVNKSENLGEGICACKNTNISVLDKNNENKSEGINAENIIPGNGATELIYLFFMYNKFKKVLIPSPAFSDYYSAAQSSGAEIVYMKLPEEKGFNYDAEEIIVAISKDKEIKCVVLCNPHNPTSSLASKDTLIKILEFTCKNEINVFIDETFIELTIEGNSNSVIDLIHQYNNLFVLRAFTKILAIPGLRLGYGISNINMIKCLLNLKMPWSINCMAEGLATYLDLNIMDEFLKKTQKWLSQEIHHLYHELKKFKWLNVYQPNTNFILLKIQKDTTELKANKLKECLIRRSKILIRDASNFKYLNDSYFRIAIKGKDENEAIIRSLKKLSNYYI